MRKLSILSLVVALVAFLVVTGCAGFQDQEAAGPRAKLADLNATFDAVRESVDNAFEEGRLTAGEFLSLHDKLAEANRALDTAQTALGEGDTDTTVGRLQIARELLAAISRELAQGGGG